MMCGEGENGREIERPAGGPMRTLVADWQKAELERRKRNYASNPQSVQPWSEVKRSILESLRAI